jgi:aminobutyraldehyde dehydrogenase
MKRTHMELGGKAPVIIFDDADIDAAVEGIRTFGFYNAGQDCTAACRIYAQKGIYDEFVRKLGEAVSTIRTGLQDDQDAELGPLITAVHRERVLGFIERAKAVPHIRVITGGKAVEGPGFFVQPTVLAGARQEDEIVQREVFGPVVSVTAFDDEAQALAYANDSDYGLASSSVGPPAVRLHLGQHPLHAGQRDASRRHEAVGIWQGHVHVRPGGLHRGSPCDGETLKYPQRYRMDRD